MKQILKLKILRTEKLILKTFGNEKPSEKLFDVVKIKLNGVKKDFVIEVLVVSQICSPITNEMVTRVSQNYSHLKNLRLADLIDEQLMNTYILNGTDFYHTFFTNEIIRSKSNEPVALSCHFGWVLSGNYKVNEKQKSENAHTFFIGNKSFRKYEPFNDDSLEMKNCFSHIYPNDIKEISDEENVFDFYKRNLSFDGKRYKVKLPFKTHYESLPDNYSIAKSRLIRLQKQLNLNPELRESHDTVIKTYLDENIVEEVKDDKTFENVHYLPHRAVIKNERDTNKIYVVFDTSAKSPKEPSLNDILNSGPCLLPLVQDILLWFRIGEMAVVADIQHAFLQISSAKPHRNLLRFLWFEDINSSDVIKHYVLLMLCLARCVVPFH